MTPPQKWQASTRTHDPFFDNKKVWPTFIFPRFRAPNTFAKLPVHALINDPQKKLQASTVTHDPLFDNNKIWPTLIFLKFVLFGKSTKLPVCTLNHDPQKKNYRHQLGPMTSFSDWEKFDPLYFQGLHPKHISKASCACPNLWPPSQKKVTGINWDPWSIFRQHKNLTHFYL